MSTNSDAMPGEALRYSSTAVAPHWLLAILLVGKPGVGGYMLSIEDEPGSGIACCMPPWIAMPLLGLSGAALSESGIEFFGRSIPRVAAPNHDLAQALFTAHSVVAWVLVALITIHVLAALKHLFIDRDGVFQRMWFS